MNSFYAPDLVGGAEVVLQSLVEGIASQGIGVAVLTTTNRPGLYREEINGIPVWRAGLRNLYWHKPSARSPLFLSRQIWRVLDIYNPLMRRFVADVVEAEKPSVVSVHNLAGWSASAWSVLLNKGVPVVQVLHDYQLMCRGLMFRRGTDCRTQCSGCSLMRLPHKQMSRHLSGVIGVSCSVLERLVDAGYFKGVSEKVVVHNARSREELGGEFAGFEEQQAHTPFRFGYIGALAPHKGIEILIRSYAQTPPLNTELWIAGEGGGEYTSKLNEMAKGAPIKFVGKAAAAEFLRSVDVVVVPSLWNEPLGTVVIEAMAFGKPVIASLVGGNPEMITDGVNGLLFKADSPNEMLSAMQRLSTDKTLCKRMGTEAKRSSHCFMNRQRFVEEHLNVYRSAEKNSTYTPKLS